LLSQHHLWLKPPLFPLQLLFPLPHLPQRLPCLSLLLNKLQGNQMAYNYFLLKRADTAIKKK
jgi:hypothetical protein